MSLKWKLQILILIILCSDVFYWHDIQAIKADTVKMNKGMKTVAICCTTQ